MTTNLRIVNLQPPMFTVLRYKDSVESDFPDSKLNAAENFSSSLMGKESTRIHSTSQTFQTRLNSSVFLVQLSFIGCSVFPLFLSHQNYLQGFIWRVVCFHQHSELWWLQNLCCRSYSNLPAIGCSLQPEFRA